MRGTAIVARNNPAAYNNHRNAVWKSNISKPGDLRQAKIYAPQERQARTNEKRFSTISCRTYSDMRRDLFCWVGTSIVRRTWWSPLDIYRALANLLYGLRLKDTWKQSYKHHVYTYYSTVETRRIDKLYHSRDFKDKKGAGVILPAAFTDHCAVVISVTMQAVNRSRGIRHWPKKPLRLKEDLYVRLNDLWESCAIEGESWENAKNYYPPAILWKQCVNRNERGKWRGRETEVVYNNGKPPVYTYLWFTKQRHSAGG
jgi:hypothetical protein